MFFRLIIFWKFRHLRTNLQDLKQNKLYNEETHKIWNRFFKNDWKSKFKILEFEKEVEPGRKKATIMEIILRDFLMFHQILLSPRVKRNSIISNKQSVYELPHKLPNDLRLRILGNKEKSGKSQNLLEW